MGRLRLILLVLLALTPSTGAQGQPPSVVRELRVAMEPALQRSGLLDHLVPAFEEAHGVRVAFRFLPTKEALALGAVGGADVVWVHAPRLGLQYLNQGFYLHRRLVMYTDYVLVGSPRDPAGVRRTRRVVEAFRKIAQSKAPFVSHGERAGSDVLEQELWKKAGVTPDAAWYIRTEASSADALVLAASRGAYLLLDRSSVADLPPTGRLQVILEGVQPLRSVYHVMEVNPHRFPHVNYRDAKAFGDYLVSPSAQQMIRTIGVDRDGRPVFFPGAGKRESDLFRDTARSDRTPH